MATWCGRLSLARADVSTRGLLVRGILWLVVGEDGPAFFALRGYDRSLDLRWAVWHYGLIKLQHHDVCWLWLGLCDLILEVMVSSLPA